MGERMDENNDEQKKFALDKSFSQDIAGTYANRVTVMGSANDVRIAFGLDNVVDGIKYSVAVYLSYTTAKQMTNILQDIINAYEKDFGQILTEPRGK